MKTGLLITERVKFLVPWSMMISRSQTCTSKGSNLGWLLKRALNLRGDSRSYLPHDKLLNIHRDGVLFDGLAGLAKSTISKQPTITLVDSLRKSGALRNSIISFKIPRLADNRHDGEMTLGGMNPARFDSRSVVTVKNQNKLGFWETPINQIKINGKSTGWTNRTGVLDTGTALLIAPQEDVDAIHSQVPGAKQVDGSWTVPCQTKVSISLTIGSMDFAIDPRDIAFIPIDGNDMQGDCWSGIGVGTVGPFHLPTTWLLGDVFLKNVYHSMNADEGKDEITFAKLK